jgi:hypothetical protein
MESKFLTKHIKISTDSVGAMSAVHKYQGTLIDSDFFESRSDCRRAAVETLREIKEDSEVSEEFETHAI